MNFLISFTLFLISSFTFGQVSYNDVAVIINDNSQNSIDIGAYFQQARNIPSQNMIHIFAPVTDQIDSLQFEQIRAQVESHLISNNLTDSINYLVTTKGIPLKMLGGCPNNVYNQSCGSVDAELALILGQYSNEIHDPSSVINPYFDTDVHFSRINYGFYLVTRLDGYTKQDVFNLIDRSGPNTGVNKLSTQSIMDLNSTTGIGDSSYFGMYHLQPCYDFLVGDSWAAQIDWEYAPLTNQDNVLFYVQQGLVLPDSVTLNFNWAEGSIASVPMCYSAETFDEANNTENKLLLADLIREGCTGAHGNVGFIYFTTMLASDMFLSRYTNPTENYNLAECFYLADNRLSWQSVFIGDPKASIIIDNSANLTETSNENISIYPIPSKGILNIESDEIISACAIRDMNGRIVMENPPIDKNFIQLDLNDLANGFYLMEIITNTGSTQERIVIEK